MGNFPDLILKVFPLIYSRVLISTYFPSIEVPNTIPAYVNKETPKIGPTLAILIGLIL